MNFKADAVDSLDNLLLRKHALGDVEMGLQVGNF